MATADARLGHSSEDESIYGCESGRSSSQASDVVVNVVATIHSHKTVDGGDDVDDDEEDAVDESGLS